MRAYVGSSVGVCVAVWVRACRQWKRVRGSKGSARVCARAVWGQWRSAVLGETVGSRPSRHWGGAGYHHHQPPSTTPATPARWRRSHVRRHAATPLSVSGVGVRSRSSGRPRARHPLIGLGRSGVWNKSGAQRARTARHAVTPAQPEGASQRNNFRVNVVLSLFVISLRTKKCPKPVPRDT